MTTADEYEAIPEAEWKELATTEITHLTDEEKDYLPHAWDEWIARVRRDAAREALDGLAVSPDSSDLTVRFRGNHPTRAYPTDAGWDLSATDDRVVPVRALVKVPTGTFVDLPAGSYGMICSRSGLVAKHGLAVANAPGIIDAGYTGEIFVTLVNLGPRPYRIEAGERIAQIVLGRTTGIHVADAPESLSNLARGENGHGSSATLSRQTDREDRHE